MSHGTRKLKKKISFFVTDEPAAMVRHALGGRPSHGATSRLMVIALVKLLGPRYPKLFNNYKSRTRVLDIEL